MRSPAETASRRRTSSRPAKETPTERQSSCARAAQPAVIAPIYIGKRATRISLRPSDPLFVGHAVDEFPAEVPHLARHFHRRLRSVGETERYLARPDNRP